MSLPGPQDLLGRPLRDLRVSVTDRCNFRCRYCMPREVFGADHAFLPRSELLTFEEISRVVSALTPLGVRKVRLTGGEPLLRRDLPSLVSMVAQTPGIEDLALTTNGSLLAASARRLREAGLRRVTVSLDSIDPDVFAALSDTKIPLTTVLGGIDKAAAVGLPVKINSVVRRGVNDAGLLDLVDYARTTGLTLRFIEYMDVGTSNGWLHDEVVPAAELVARIGDRFPLEPVESTFGEVAKRYRYLDGAGEIGFVTSVTEPFCGSCTRLRLSAVGELYTCLFGSHGFDLRTPLRAGATEDELAASVAGLWSRRGDRYSEVRGERSRNRGRAAAKVEMSYIGG